MQHETRKLAFASVVGVLLHGTLTHAQEDQGVSNPNQDSRPTRLELQEKQLDVTLEARDIERVLTKLKRASDLSKERIAEAATVAESAATAIDRGESQSARTDAQKAAELFREIAKQLEALLAEETPQRIEAARNLASELAIIERQFAQQFPGVLNPNRSGGQSKIDPKSMVKPDPKQQAGQGNGGGRPKADEEKPGQGPARTESDKSGAGSEKDPGDAKSDKNSDEGQGGKGPERQEKKPNGDAGSGKEQNDEPKDDKPENGTGGELSEEEQREALARRAEQLAQAGKTLDDVLKAITQSTDPEDKDAVTRVNEIIQETDLPKAIEAMQEAAELIRSGQLDDARLASLDVADRMEITGQRLDAAYRAIVAPQAEDLIKLERELADLRAELDELETPSQVRTWHRELDQMLEELDKLGISPEAREDLLRELKKLGWGTDDFTRTLRGLVVSNGRYQLPADYTLLLTRVQEELQTRIQNLILGDLTSATDEVAPPKYQQLVERYLQVLSREGGQQRFESKRERAESQSPHPKRFEPPAKSR